MSYLDHLRACNTQDLSGYRPFWAAGRRVGWVRHALAERLCDFAGIFVVAEDRVALDDCLDDFDTRTRAVAEAVDDLVAAGVIPTLRGEFYGVVTRWNEPALFKIDRTAVPHFGIRSFGIHVNGIVQRPDGPHLWIGRRAADRRIAPGKLDNLIAGGQPHGLGLMENLLKEAEEEAGLSADMARRARPVGAIRYLMENHAGLKPDTLFLYDLELPAGFEPRNTDGEVERFDLMPVPEVARIVRETDDFKFNVNLVIIDYLIRHGHLTPEEPDYLDLVLGLRRNDR